MANTGETIRVIDSQYVRGGVEFTIHVDRVTASTGKSEYVGIATVQHQARSTLFTMTPLGHDSAESAYQACIDTIDRHY